MPGRHALADTAAVDWTIWFDTSGFLRTAAFATTEVAGFNFNTGGSALAFREGPDGTAAYPSRTYLLDTDTGAFRAGANNEGFSAGGTLRWDYDTTRIKLSTGYNLQFGDDVSLGRGGANVLLLASGDTLAFGGITSSEVLIKRASATFQFRLGNDSAFADVLAAGATFTGSVSAGASSVHNWTGRSVMSSPADGQLNLTNTAGTAGAGFDFATDAILKVRTRAQSAYATVDALGYSVSGAAGVSFGPAAVASITVVNGIVTAIS